MIHRGLEAVPDEEALHIDDDRLRPVGKAVGHKDLDTVHLVAPISVVDLLALEVGVDRHLGVTPSTNGWNEVQGGDPTLAPHVADRFGCHRDVESHAASVRVRLL